MFLGQQRKIIKTKHVVSCWIRINIVFDQCALNYIYEDKKQTNSYTQS